ncbi:hypothetical protein BYT27DRAFT_6422072 [Phlegmacium glaucopus]|nr:hypothetical protein BYT27DRAFT_6422072 [Phlegmacium glaucopus]
MDPDCLLPPPAYSEQEFDQKITQATALSLQASRVSNTDPDGWPQYDPASFEASFPSEGSSTSPTTDNNHYMQRDIINDLPSVVPLRIEKKSQQRKNLDKPPAIYQPRNESSSLTIGENPAPVYPGTPDRDHFRSRIHSEGDISLTTAVPIHSTQIPNHERGANLIPPPPHSEAQPPAWPPESSPVTRPFVYDNHYQHHVNPYNTTPSQSPRQSLPVQSRPRFVPQGRPMTGYPPSPDNFQSSYVPRLDFNPSVAYGKTQPVTHSPLQQPVKHVQYDPHAFYNSVCSTYANYYWAAWTFILLTL